MATQAKVEKKNKIATYFKGVKTETKKVVWPTMPTLINYTLVVIAVSILISAIVYGLDLGIAYIYSLIV